jgi:hypothetical protein
MIKKHNIDFFTPIAKISTKSWIKRKFIQLIKPKRTHATLYTQLQSQTDIAKRHEEFFKQLINEIGGKDKFIQETNLFYNYSYTELTNLPNINISARFIDFILTTLPHNILQTHKLYKQITEFHSSHSKKVHEYTRIFFDPFQRGYQVNIDSNTSIHLCTWTFKKWFVSSGFNKFIAENIDELTHFYEQHKKKQIKC